MVADKTGSLIATSALFGAKVAGAEPSVQRALAAYGEEIGIVFQLCDDIIDITSDETGKTPGTDLREGIPTLPTPAVPRSADPTSPADARLLQLLDSDLREDADLAEALGLLRAHPCVDQARAEVQRRADRARSFLTDLPAGPARDALADLCDYGGHPRGVIGTRCSLRSTAPSALARLRSRSSRSLCSLVSP